MMINEHLEQLQKFVGLRLQTLLRSRDAAEASLDDAEPKIRWAALILLTYHWCPTDKFKQKCEQMALHDVEDLVRSKAVGSLGACFARTGNRRIQALLADIVCSEQESYKRRRSAYLALLIVNGQQRMPAEPRAMNLRIPEDINWAFVRSVRALEQV